MRLLLMLLSGVFVLAIVTYLSFFIGLNVVGAKETWLTDRSNISHEKIALGFVRFDARLGSHRGRWDAGKARTNTIPMRTERM